MEIYLDPEEQIMCPYNSAHHIRRKRMNTHLVKCKKNYPDAKLVECDFNVDHKIPEPELQYHHENCPDRKKVEILTYQEEGVDLNQYPVMNIAVSTDESWDDLNVPTYDPKTYCEGNEILRHKDVESAAKRRDFRVSERRRHGQFLEKNNESEANTQKDSINSESLPPPRRVIVEEDTPDSIQAILARIKLGAKQSFVPKTD